MKLKKTFSGFLLFGKTCNPSHGKWKSIVVAGNPTRLIVLEVTVTWTQPGYSEPRWRSANRALKINFHHTKFHFSDGCENLHKIDIETGNFSQYLLAYTLVPLISDLSAIFRYLTPTMLQFHLLIPLDECLFIFCSLLVEVISQHKIVLFISQIRQ